MMLILTLLPIFSVIVIGWLVVRTGYLDSSAVAPAAQVVLRIALPAVIFLALASAPRGEAFDLLFLLVYCVASLLALSGVYALARLVLGMSKSEATVIALGASMANSAFMGFPIGQAILGQAHAVRVFAHVLIVENLIMLPIALLLLTAAGNTTLSRVGVLREVLRNPLVIALVSGGAISALGVTLPEPATAILELLGRLSAPLALLVIGGMLATLPASGQLRAVMLIVGGKLVIHPFLVGVGVVLVPGVTPAMAVGGVLFAAMPMITIFPLLSARVGQGQLAAFGLLSATVLSFLSLPVIIHYLGLT